MKIRTSFVPKDVVYLTEGKVYEVFDDCHIIGDKGEDLVIFLECCAHLDYLAWEIVEE